MEAAPPDFVEVPGTLKSLSFIQKNARRFPDASGRRSAEVLHDAASGKFT